MREKVGKSRNTVCQFPPEIPRIHGVGMQPIAQIEKCNMNMALFISSFHRLPVALGRATKPDWLRHGGVRNRCPGTSCVLGEESVTEVGALRVSHQHSCCW